MTLEEKTKYCPHCHAPFICRPEHVRECQCAGATLSEAARAHIRSHYEDCLCISCLLAISAEIKAEEDGTAGV